MYLKKHKNGRFGIEIGGYLANLQIPKYQNKTSLSNIGNSEVCFVSGGYDCLTIGEIIKIAGYDPNSILNRRLLVTIEDEIQLASTADYK